MRGYEPIVDALAGPVLILGSGGRLVHANQAAAPYAAGEGLSRLAALPLGRSTTVALVDPVAGAEIAMTATAKGFIGAGGEELAVITLSRSEPDRTLLQANVSHEVRTPLNAIVGYTRMLLQGVAGELSVRQRQAVERVDSNAQHLVGLMNDFLDAAKADAGKMPVDVARFDLGEVLRETIGELEALSAQARVPVHVTLAPLAPVASDRRKVKQIVQNLLTNALEFTPSGEVRVELAEAGDRARVSVTDTGIGIAPADQASIFDDFWQVDSSLRRTHPGAGLGLAICRRFAGLLGGSISVDSALGRGSTFTLLLPMEARHV